MTESEFEPGVEIDSLETTGVIVDKAGNRWAIPSEANEDYTDLQVPLPLEVDKKRLDPRFYYQFIRPDQLAAYVAMEFAPVTRAELGLPALPEALAREYGQTQDSIYRVGDAVYVKIPQVLADRLRKRKNALVDAAVSGAGPTEAMKEFAKSRGIKLPTPQDSRQSVLPGVMEENSLRIRKVDEPLS